MFDAILSGCANDGNCQIGIVCERDVLVLAQGHSWSLADGNTLYCEDCGVDGCRVADEISNCLQKGALQTLCAERALIGATASGHADSESTVDLTSPPNIEKPISGSDRMQARKLNSETYSIIVA